MSNIGVGTGTSLSVTGVVQGASLVGNAIIVPGSSGCVRAAIFSATSTVSATGNITGGNLSAVGSVKANSFVGGLLSSTGSVVGMSVAGNNISSSSLINAVSNITGGNLLTAGRVSAAGNITGNYFIGNGSQLTGLQTAGPAFIATITQGVAIPASPNPPIAQLPILYNNIVKNVGNGYYNGVFTAPLAGFYQVSAALAPGFTPPSNPNLYYGAGALGIYKNNIPIAAGPFVEVKTRSWGPITGWVIDASNVSILVDLNAGDTLQCKFAYITNYFGFTTYANAVPNYFQACWLRSF